MGLEAQFTDVETEAGGERVTLRSLTEDSVKATDYRLSGVGSNQRPEQERTTAGSPPPSNPPTVRYASVTEEYVSFSGFVKWLRTDCALVSASVPRCDFRYSVPSLS